ncbi:response regulator transcription factor [Lachnospiraceae bacterium MD308]|nr:response regulator transcription factor [Lachnospiraceae bacterium MD308]MCI8581226.1 response regulator transcription factor [Dorea sp.]
MENYKYKILIVDDNAELVNLIAAILKEDGYRKVLTAGSMKEGMEIFRESRPDMAVLDIMLPDGDGFSMFAKMREESEIPILFLSAKDEDEDRLFGLGLGADDYITKPFLPKELLLRVRAVLKRTYHIKDEKKETVIRLGERKVLPERAAVWFDGEETPLTAKELALLMKLSQNRGRIVTFDALCNAVWGDFYYGYENTLMVHIRHLREKLEDDPSHPKWILTARGLGYRLKKEQP